jgi:CheY-like chemotaxis protein
MTASIATILYVDDNVKARRLLGSILIDCGFEVVATGDPAEAIREFSNVRFDGALIDYRMPIMSGPDLAFELKTLHPDVPIVMLYGATVLTEKELLCVDAHFGAGTSLHDLLSTLRTLIRSRPEQRLRAATAGWAEST